MQLLLNEPVILIAIIVLLGMNLAFFLVLRHLKRLAPPNESTETESQHSAPSAKPRD